jgi:uncharacterized protein involved in exopolysaccharide biosynthesis
MSDNRTQEVNLLDLVAFVLRWRVFLITAILSVSAVVAVISLVLPPKYRSTAVVRGAETQSPGLGSLVASKLAALGGISGFAPALGEIPGELYVAILRSRWMSESAITTLDLRKTYGLEDAPIEDVVATFKARTRYELDPQSQTITISADDQDPRRAQSVATFLVDALDRRNSELRSSNARRQREFVGQRLDDAKRKLTELEDSLARFQIESGVLNLEEQVKATIGAAAALEAEKLALESELEMNRQLYDTQSSVAEMIRFRLSGIESTLRRLSAKKTGADRDFDFLLHLKDAPGHGLIYLRLTRDIEVQQILVALLLQQYEQANIDEKRNTPTILRLDPPTLAAKRVWPRRGIMVGVSAFAALVLSCGFALAFDSLRKAAADPAHPQHRRLQNIREAFRRPRDHSQA